ncbi:hypothetical protein HMI55_004502 [Coelomomyces lativittatus]|nr:hypothetical protein HMI55_004502 [Coelomomyces lativittatus]
MLCQVVARSCISVIPKSRIHSTIYLHLGRGAYYKAKYARPHHLHSANSWESNLSESKNYLDNPEDERFSLVSSLYSLKSTKTVKDLDQLISSIDHNGYGAYKRLQGTLCLFTK